jgi:DNA-binding winged helix-turn-helix (wHTH) protein/tetratricopeptide (TPR) repeat protein
VGGVSFFFGEFELDASTYKLLRAGRQIPLQPKVFDAIRYLLEHHDQVVLKEELLDALWPGEHINDTAVPWTISRARKVLGQAADANHPIVTVRGRGYRFTGEIRQGGASERPPDPTTAVRPAEEPVRSRVPSDPFVGRADAMERLLGALHEANTGRGRLCLITGEAGIGKTRCISEFAVIARRLKVSVWTGRCLEGGRTAAFWPWVQVLRDALSEGALAPAPKQGIQKLLLELGQAPEAGQVVADVAASSAVAARFWVLEKLSRVLLSAETAPRVILLDDVQWADEASLDLLIFLSAELSRAPALVVATARDPLLAGSEAWAKALGRLGPCERIELVGLRSSDVEHYVTEVTGLSLPADIQRTVYTKCGGNPLFLQETARLLAALGERGGAQSLRADDITVPGVAKDVLRARLTGLPAATCEALEFACVLGQEFDLPVLQSALGVEVEDLLVRLDEVVCARLIAPRRRAGTYSFTHDTIREALYEELSTPRRVELHGRVARAYEERSGGDFRLNDLAYHYYRALPRAAPAVVQRYARMAGEAAMRGFAYEDAAEFFGWALDAQRFREDGDARSHCELLLDLASAFRLSGRIRDAYRSVERAIEIARTNRFADLLSEAVRRLRPFSSVALVSDPLALQALEDASKLLTEDQRSLRIRVLGQLACIPPYSLSVEKSRELGLRAIALARQSGDVEDLIEALKGSFHALSGPDHIDELLASTDEILHLDAYLTSLGRGDAEVARYRAFLHKGDISAATEAVEELGRLGRVLRRPETLWHYERHLAQMAFHRGDFQAAQTKFQELAARSRQLRLPNGKFFFIMETLLLAYERFGVANLQISAREWRTDFEWAWALPTFRAHELRFTLEVGDREEARRSFDAMAQAGFENITRDLGFLNTLAQLSLVAVELGDRDRAEVLYDLLGPYPRHNTPTNFGFYLGSVSYYLGQLAGLLGRTGDAVGHLEEALEMNTALGFVPQVARTQLALAEALSEEGGKAARARAVALLAEANGTARRLEMGPLAAQIERFRGRPSVGASRLRAR